MEDDSHMAQDLSHLLARVAAIVARDEDSDTSLPALPQFGGSLWAPSPPRPTPASPFLSLAADVSGDADGRRALPRHSCGPAGTLSSGTGLSGSGTLSSGSGFGLSGSAPSGPGTGPGPGFSSGLPGTGPGLSASGTGPGTGPGLPGTGPGLSASGTGPGTGPGLPGTLSSGIGPGFGPGTGSGAGPGFGARPSSSSVSPTAAKTPSTAVSPMTAGLTPTTFSASATRPHGTRGETATATTSASSTPFLFQQSQACGASVCDPLSSLNQLLNLSPVNTPHTNRTSQSHGHSVSHAHSTQSGLVMLNGGSYTMPQHNRSSASISPTHSLSTMHHPTSHRPRHLSHLQHMHNSQSSKDVMSESFCDSVVFPPGGHTLPSSSSPSSSSIMMMRSSTRDAVPPSPTRMGHFLNAPQPTGGDAFPVSRADTDAAANGTACTLDASLRVPFQLSLHRGSVVKMGNDQHGCRALQSVLECYAFGSLEVQCIVSELRPALPEVMTNPYGNFLVQKLLEIAPDQERLELLSQHLSASLCEVAVSPHGNYAVQKLIDSLRSREEIEVVCAALQRNILSLMKDLNGGHVVQKLLQCLPPGDLLFLYDTIVDYTLDVCNDKQGCCIVQKCMDYASREQLLRLQKAILRHLLPLSMSPYGNYVVTHLVNCCSGKQQGFYIVDEAAFCAGPAMVLLCVNKFASNVVENIVRHCSEHAKVELCRLILQGAVEEIPFSKSDSSHAKHYTNNNNNNHSSKSKSNNLGFMTENILRAPKSTVLRTIALNPFGNYVIQTLLSVLPVGPELLQLLRCLQGLLPELMELNFGKRVETRMDHAKFRIAQHRQQKGAANETNAAHAHSEGIFQNSAAAMLCAEAATINHAAAAINNHNNHSHNHSHSSAAVKAAGQGKIAQTFFAAPSSAFAQRRCGARF